jgi:hypothetical protein
MIPVSSVIVTLDGMTMGANPTSGGSITVTTSQDRLPSASTPSGPIDETDSFNK